MVALSVTRSLFEYALTKYSETSIESGYSFLRETRVSLMTGCERRHSKDAGFFLSGSEQSYFNYDSRRVFWNRKWTGALTRSAGFLDRI